MVIASTTERSELNACCAGCNLGFIAAEILSASIVSTSLLDISNREIGRTSSLLVGCIIGPTPLTFSMHYTRKRFK